MLLKIIKYIGFYVHHRSYYRWPPVILQYSCYYSPLPVIRGCSASRSTMNKYYQYIFTYLSSSLTIQYLEKHIRKIWKIEKLLVKISKNWKESYPIRMTLTTPTTINFHTTATWQNSGTIGWGHGCYTAVTLNNICHYQFIIRR